MLWRLAIRETSRLGRTPKLVALMLSTWMDGDGVCWPSRSTLASACSLTERGVDKALAELGEFLTIERTAGGNPKTSRNRYRAILPPVNAVHGSGANGVHGSSGGGANGVPTGANGEAATGERRSPEVVQEVVQEDSRERERNAAIAARIVASLGTGSEADLTDLLGESAA